MWSQALDYRLSVISAPQDMVQVHCVLSVSMTNWKKKTTFINLMKKSFSKMRLYRSVPARKPVQRGRARRRRLDTASRNVQSVPSSIERNLKEKTIQAACTADRPDVRVGTISQGIAIWNDITSSVCTLDGITIRCTPTNRTNGPLSTGVSAFYSLYQILWKYSQQTFCRGSLVLSAVRPTPLVE